MDVRLQPGAGSQVHGGPGKHSPFSVGGGEVMKLVLFGHSVYSHCQVLDLCHEQLGQQEPGMTGKPWESLAAQ